VIRDVVLLTTLHTDSYVHCPARTEREKDIPRGDVGEGTRIEAERSRADGVVLSNEGAIEHSEIESLHAANGQFKALVPGISTPRLLNRFEIRIVHAQSKLNGEANRGETQTHHLGSS